MRILGIQITVAVLVLAATMAVASPAPHASAGCNPNRAGDSQSYIAGAYRSPGSQVGGVYSSVYNYPDPYTQLNIGYSEQSVRVKYTSTLRASVGWREWQTGGGGAIVRYTYVWYKKSSTTSGTFFLAPAQPEWNYSYYTVLHNRSNPGTLTFQVNNSTILTISNVLWIPTRGESFGESYTLASQMPGDPNNVSDMNNTHIWYNGAWQSFNGTNTFISPYHYAYGSGLNYVVEDLGCSS